MFVDDTSIDIVLRGLVLSSIAACWVIFVVRVIGLRSFSKITAIDFVTTVAIGSLLAGASQATNWGSFIQAAIAIAALLTVQFLFARLRMLSDRFSVIVQNAPVLLMRDGKAIPAALKSTRVAEEELRAKLREAGVTDISEVRAVVLEPTGDFSVIEGGGMQETLLDGVRRRD